MSEQADPYEGLTSGVVVGHDRSASADRALVFGAEEARLRGWPLHVVRAWSLTHAPRPEGVEAGIVPPLEEYGEAVRRELAADVERVLGAEPGVEVDCRAIHGSAHHVLVAASARVGLLVVSSRGHGRVVGALLGSTSTHVVQHADCPVVVLRG